MRALGPGSVSSFLKVILDVVHWILLFSAAAASVGIVVVLLLSFKPELLGGIINIGGMHVGRESTGGRAIMVLLVDEGISEDLMRLIRAFPGMEAAQLVHL